MGEKLNPNKNIGVIEGDLAEDNVSFIPPEVGDEGTTGSEAVTETPSGKETATPKKPDVDQKTGDSEPLPKGVIKRINKITKQKYDALRDREEVNKKYEAERERNAQLERELQEAKTAKQLAEHVKTMPKKDSFESEEEYMVSLADWAAQKTALETAAKPVKPEPKPETEKEQTKPDDKVQTAIEKGIEKYPDFDQVVFDPELKLSTEMARWISDSDVAGDIYYYLGKHPEESAKIFELGGRQMERALTRIEIQFAEPSKDEEPEIVDESVSKKEGEVDPALKSEVTQSPKVTQAPEPITPLEGRTVPKKTPEQMTNEEYRRYRGFGKDARRRIKEK